MSSVILAQPGMKIIFRGSDCVIEDSNEVSVGIISGGKRTRIAYRSNVSTESGRIGHLSRVFDPNDGIYFLFEEQIRLIFQKILYIHDEPFSPFISELVHECVNQIRRTERTVLFQRNNGQRIFRSHSLNLQGRIPNTIRSKPQLIEAVDFAISLGPKGMPLDSQLSSLRRRIAAQGKGWSSTGFSSVAIKMMTAEGLTVTDVLRCLELGVESSVIENWSNSRWEKLGTNKAKNLTREMQVRAVWRGFDFDPNRFSNILAFGLNLEESLKIYVSRIPSNYLNSWFANFEEFAEIDGWIAAGFTRPETAREWRDAGFKVSEAEDWYDLDFSSASEAMDWCTSLLSLEDSRSIRELGIFSIVEALEWKVLCDDFASVLQINKQFAMSPEVIQVLLRKGIAGDHILHLLNFGIAADVIVEWSKVGQDLLRQNQIELWMRQDIDPQTALKWMGHGISPSTASAMILKGFNFEDWQEWNKKTDSENLVEELIQNFSARESILAWLDSDVDSAQRISSVRSGIPFETFSNWSAIGVVQSDLILGWIKSGVLPRIARIWVSGGVTNPLIAAEWTNEKFTPVDSLRAMSIGFSDARVVASYSNAFFGGRRLKAVEFLENCVQAKISKEVLDEWIVRGWNGSGVEYLVEMFSRPDEIIKWNDSKIPQHSWCFWVPICEGHLDVAIAWFAAKFEPSQLMELSHTFSFKPIEVRAWIEEGFVPKDFINALRSDTRIPVEWRNTLSRLEIERQERSIAKERWEKWLTSATQTFPLSELSKTRWQPFLRHLFNEGYSVTRNSNIRLDASGEWYDEVAGRVVLLKKLLRKEPKWPTWYSSSDFKIGCFESGGQVLCWIGKGGRGRLVGFDSETFEPATEIKNNDELLVYGLAMSWFLDSSLLLQRQMETISCINGVYVPNKNFSSYLKFQLSDRSIYIRACEIAGHLRLLPDGMNPSENQRALAPKYLQSRMESQHTYVRPHHRNGEDLTRQIAEHLLRYSATASSVSLLNEI